MSLSTSLTAALPLARRVPALLRNRARWVAQPTPTSVPTVFGSLGLLPRYRPLTSLRTTDRPPIPDLVAPVSAVVEPVLQSPSLPFEPPTAAPLAYARGDHTVPLLNETIGTAFDRTVAAYADELALVVRHEDVRLTYRELGAMVDQVAGALVDHGFQPGDRLGVFMPNTAAWTILQYATAKIGVIMATINPGYRTGELKFALNLVGCRGLILTPSFRSSDYIKMIRELVPEVSDPKSAASPLRSAQVPTLETIFVTDPVAAGSSLSSAAPWRSLPGLRDYQELLTTPTSAAAAARVSGHTALLQPNQAINILFTSGTTGNPKAVGLTHYNLINNGLFTGQTLGLTPADAICCPLPLYHCFGLVLGNLASLVHGSTMVFPGPAFEAHSVLAAIEEEKCTALYGVPTMFIEAMAHPNFARTNLTSLRTGIMSGSPCPIEVMRAVIERMNMSEVIIGLGMTETSPITFLTRRDDPVDKRVSTVGRPIPHVEAKVVNVETGETVAVGQKGELCVRGFGIMQGYWEDPVSTAKTVDHEGWLRTGDLAVLAADGFCQVVGRAKDLIIRGGENIYPAEIENCLFEHPHIANVLIVGVPDPKYGEQVCACIIPLDSNRPVTLEEVREFCQEKLAHFKLPRYVLTMTEFPKTVTGKLRRNVMAETAARELLLKA
ncbi:hypothetical protein IWQ60_004030 [Tieghemiomyces parasiticus]|uniref:Uncharacterized protein n=1 Tax=Tieghemiomyces parasiticus TaxID=78921 RepID=A0A9W8A908_9FUNG|nr:hypothetical protein IWQ60_004030 [Tieghemiomyces parasiticus]